MLFDISPLVSEDYPVWPSDPGLKREIAISFEKGDAATVSSINSTVHVGAHADAPSHFEKNGISIEKMPLEHYIGPCQVIEVKVNPRTKITPSDLPVEITAPRVLFKTNTALDGKNFVEDFAALSPDLIDFLAKKNVVLVGIDTPSVDLYTECTLLESHKRANLHNMAILECLKLDEVPAGQYELIALPLNLKGFDASPVRAVLRS